MPVRAATLTELLAQRAQLHPEKRLYTFLEDDSEPVVDHAHLHLRARSIAAALQAHTRAGERAVLLYPPGLEYIAGFFGCLDAGIIAVPAYPPDPSRLDRTLPRLLSIIEDSRATLVLTTSFIFSMTEFLFEQAPALKALRWVATDAVPVSEADGWRDPDVRPETIAFLQYTSGSTGMPKGVILSHGNLIANTRVIFECFDLRSTQDAVIWLPPYHDMGLIGGILTPLYSGFHCALLSPLAFLKSPRRWLEALTRFRGQVGGGPNFAYELCIRKVGPEEREGLELSNWSVAFSGAEPIRAETLDRFVAAFGPYGFKRESFYPCYGLAEGTLIASGGASSEPPILREVEANPLRHHQVVLADAPATGTRTLVSSGRQLADHELTIVDPETRRGCPEGGVGEIWLRGPSVAQGYWMRPEETAHAFDGRTEDGAGPYLRTGDLGFMLGGELYVSGRLKDLIIIRGLNIYPQDLEATVDRCHPALRGGCAAAFAVEVEGEERLVIVQEVDLRRGPDLGEVVEAIRAAVTHHHELPPYAVALLHPGAIHKTTSGKIQRRACKAAFQEDRLELAHLWRAEDAASADRTDTALPAGAEDTSVDPAPGIPTRDALLPLESAARRAWLVRFLTHEAATQLRVAPARVPAEQALSTLGFDSISAIELTNTLEVRLGLRLPVETVLRAPHLVGLADALLPLILSGALAPALPLRRRRVEDGNPLSFGQERLWLLHQLDPESAVYNVPAALRFSAPVDPQRVERAFRELGRRHEVLRATYRAVEGRPVQDLAPELNAPLTVIDLRAVPAAEREEAARLQARTLAQQPFDLTRGPLARIALLTLADDDQLLVIVLHHIVTDGWSLLVLARELAAIHDALAAGAAPALPPLAVQYPDFAGWQRASLAGDALAPQLAYWKQQLTGAPAVLDLPVARARPAEQSYRGGRHPLHLPRPLTDALIALGQREGTTLFMTLLGAFQVLLHRYSGQETVCVGSPIAGRNRAELEGLLGFFVNTLVLRGDLSGAPTFQEVLRRVRETALGAYAHQDLPFERLVDELQPTRSRSHAALFQVMFVLQQLEGAAPTVQGRPTAVVHVDNGTSMFDLNMSLMEAEDGLRGWIDYSADLFDAATVARLMGHFQVLLEGLVARPDAPVATLALLTAEEQAQQLVDWTRTRVELPEQGFPALFEAQVARTPDAIAAGFEAEAVSYRELDRRANRLAHELVAAGVGPDRVVPLLAERGLDFLVAMLGVFKAGGAYLPLDPLHPPQRLAQVLSQVHAPLALVSSGLEPAFAQAQALLAATARARVLRLDAPREGRWSDLPLPTRARPENLAYVIFTSGSTGLPKGAMLEHRGMVNHLHAKALEFSLTAGDVVAQTASQCFDISVWQFLVALLVGGRTQIFSTEVAQTPARLLVELEETGTTIVETVPSLLRALLETADALGPTRPALGVLRWMVPTGEALPPDVCRHWFTAYPAIPLLNAYGPTECSDDVTHHPLRQPPTTPNTPIGRAVANMRMYILGRRGELLPLGVPGELFVAGIGVGRGYLGDPRRTAEVFVPDPFSSVPGARLYRTGDLARHLPDGTLEFLGRLDHQVKVRGFRIELGEIELALSAAPSVKQAIVVAREDAPGLKRLAAYLVPAPGAAVDPAALRAFLLERLPDYMVPAAFVALAAFPLTSNGKVDRAALPAPEPAVASAEAVAPRSPVEATLARIWALVLGRDAVGVHDNFFELGGDSIISMQIIARASQAGLSLTPRQIFQHQTIAELARVATPSAPSLAGEQGAVEGAVPLTAIQRAFLAQGLPRPEHDNQAVMLEATGAAPVDAARLEAALAEVIAHHDALRLRFTRDASGSWSQGHAGAAQAPVQVRRITLPDGEERTQRAALEAEATAVQASLDLGAGPLVAAALVERGADRPALLLIAIHHLVVDAVSWRPILEDLELAYHQLGRGEPVALPAKTLSFKAWAERVAEHARSSALDAEQAAWLEAGRAYHAPLPTELTGGENSRASERTLTVALDAASTRLLLEEVPAAYRARIDEVVLAAVAGSLARWAGRTQLSVELEGHGRDLFEDADLSRTVGWFTAQYPVALELPETAEPGATLRAVRDALRRLPGHGIGHGLLRHLRDDDGARALRALPSPDVAFNYLGQLDHRPSGPTAFRLSREPTGAVKSAAGHRGHLLELDAAVRDGRLELGWTFSAALHRPETIAAIAEDALARLRALVARRHAPEAARYTPADFPLARLAPPELERVLAQVPHPEDLYPLSPMQQGMLFHVLLAPESAVYFEQFGWTLHSALDVPALHRAWEAVVARHPALRTAFVWEGLATPLQVVLPTVELPWTELDWRDVPSARRAARLEEHLRADRARGFDLATAPLLRLTLIRLGENERRLVWSFHHLILDGWSVGLVVQEVFAFYDAALQGHPLHLPRAPAYREHLAWQQRGEPATTEAYWREALEGFTAPTPLPGAKSAAREGIDAAEPGRHALQLSADTTVALRDFARHHQLTLNTLIQGAWALLLSRFSGERDVVFGTTLAGRPPGLAGAESTVGLFINTLPVRAHLPRHATLLPWLRQLQAQQLALGEHEHTPLVRVQAWSEVPRGLPLFESLLIFENYPLDESVRRHAAGLDVRDFTAIEQTHYPLTLTFFPGERLGLQLTYATARFDAAAIERLVSHLTLLLERLSTAAEESPIAALPRLPAPEQQRLLVEWNRTRAPIPAQACPHELIEGQAARTPNAVAASFRQQRLTYAALNGRANRMARLLVEEGVGPDGVVPLLAERGLDVISAMLAVAKAGGAFLPLDPLYPPQRLAQILQQSRAARVVVSRELAPLLDRALELLPPGERPATLDLERSLSVPRDDGNLTGRAHPAALAYLIYTSGSTGVPKGAMVEHRGMLNHLLAKNRDLGVRSEDVIAQTSSQSFDIFVFQCFAALIAGGRTHVISRDDALSPSRLLSELREQGVTVLNIVPSQLRALVDEAKVNPTGRLALGALRWMVPTGEALPPELCREWMALIPGVPLLNAYGHTECSDDQAHHPMREPPLGATTPIGRPIQNLRFYVLDAELHPLPQGATGELFIGGVGVGRGYLGDPLKTAEKFLPDPFAEEGGARLYRTGDLGRWLPDGTLEMLGRVDFMVKLRGFRVELGEIEAVLGKHPGVRDAVVLVREEPGAPQRLLAYVVARPGEALDRAHLRAHLEERLPEHMVPSAFVLLDALPLTPNGKVDRRALPAPDLEPAAGFVAPRSAVERRLAEIWARVLGLERVGLHDHFFERGGHSLLATQALSLLRDAFDVELPLRELFEAPTLSALAERVEAALRGARSAGAPKLARVDRDQPLPLSFAQARLWFLDKLEPRNPAYNIPGALRLTGALDVAALEKSLAELLRRHEVLRTTFADHEGEPVQEIWPPPALPLAALDLSELDEAAREEQVQRQLQREAERPFDLARGPLFRASLLRSGAREHVLLLTLHHSVADGGSLAILIAELVALYPAFARGDASPLPELPLQYADYAAWQREWLKGDVLEAQLAYWRARLADAPRALELPTDRPRPALQAFRGASLPVHVSRERAEAIQALARREGVTPFMVLLAAFQVLLARHSGQDDISVGTPIAGRNRTELEGLIGFFVNTLVLRTSLAGAPSFREVLARVRETTLGAYAHQDVPFEKLVETLRPARDLSRGPFFQAMLVLQQDPLPALRIPGLSVEALEVDNRTAKFDLTLSLNETADGLRGALQFNVDLFEVATARRLIGHLGVLLEAATTAPERPISTLPLLPRAERERLLAEGSATQNEPPREGCVHALFEAQARRVPDALAVVAEDGQLTYRALNARANQLAHRLIREGVGPDSRVGLCLERSTDAIVGLLGILKAGGAYVPLEPGHPAERRSAILADAGATALVTQESLLAGLEGFAGARLLLDAERAALAREPDADPPRRALPASLVYAIFTSGSTGRPKGVAVEHRQLVHYVEGVSVRLELPAEASYASVTTLAADLGNTAVFPALCRGGTLHLISRERASDPEALALYFDQHPVDVLKIVPSHLAALLASPTPARLLPRRRLVLGGDSSDWALIERVHALAPECRVFNHYGPTETTVGVLTHPAEQGRRAHGAATLPLGRPLPHAATYLVDPGMEPVPVGVIGELLIGGLAVTRGYLHAPEATAERFVPDPFSREPGARLYRSGDRARLLPDGTVEFLGRVDHQLKLRGFRIELGELDAVLAAHPLVQDAVVVARDDGAGEKRLVAYLAPKPGAALTVEAIAAHLAAKVPDHMVPSAFVLLEALPLTANGKVDRRALPAPPAPAPRAAAPHVAPRTEVERTLARQWEALLHVEEISVHASFFELGGHSLLAVRLMAQLHATFGRSLPVAALFQGPTIASLAALLETAPAPWSPLVPLQPEGDLAPLFLIHPTGGNVLCYAELARRLGPAQPVYGLQAHGLDGVEPPHATIEAMAEAYLAAIRAVQPEGPYHLGGWSMGGVVAYEMAQQLRRRGEQVALLALLDSRTRSAGQQVDPEELAERTTREFLEVASQLLGREIDLPEELLFHDDPDALLTHLQEEGRKAGIALADGGLDQIRALRRVFVGNLQATWRYALAPYPGEAALLRAREQHARHALDREHGWGPLATGGLEVVEVPGAHETMLGLPHVGDLAERLRALLAQARRRHADDHQGVQ